MGRCWIQPGHSLISLAFWGGSARVSHGPWSPVVCLCILQREMKNSLFVWNRKPWHQCFGGPIPAKQLAGHWTKPTRGAISPQSSRTRQGSLNPAWTLLLGLQMADEERNGVVRCLCYELGHHLLWEPNKERSENRNTVVDILYKPRRFMPFQIQMVSLIKLKKLVSSLYTVKKICKNV